MFCPKCGNENSLDQRFCRDCGLNLEIMSEVIEHQHELNALDDSEEGRGLRENPLFYGFLLLVFGVVLSAIGGKIFHVQKIVDLGNVLTGIATAFFVIKGLLLFNRFRAAAVTAQPPAEKTNELNVLPEARDLSDISEFTGQKYKAVYAERDDPGAPASNIGAKSSRANP